MAHSSAVNRGFVALMAGVLMSALVALCVATPMAYAESIGGATVKTNKTYTYTGESIQYQKGDVTVTLNGKNLVPDTEYEVTYSSKIEVGDQKIRVTGVGKYTGTAWGSFTIKPAPLSALDVIWPKPQDFTGFPLEPQPTITFNGKPLKSSGNYKLSWSNNVHAGKNAIITLTGYGNFTGTHDKHFGIKRVDINRCTVDAISDKTYNGSQIKPKVTVRLGDYVLKQNRDYTVTYGKNTNAGTGNIAIKGIGDFGATKKVSFTINKASLRNAKVASISSKTYTGNSFKPTPKVTYKGKTLKKGKDYTLSYSNNKNAGTATVTVKPKSKNFKDSKKVHFTIHKASINDATIYSIDDQAYHGGDSVKPNPTIKFNGKTLKKNKDYTLSYKNNRHVGSATVTIKGKKNFKGTASRGFIIEPRNIDYGDVYISYIDDRQYTGSPITPEPTVKVDGKTLKRYSDYNLYYQNNTYVGTAFITIVGINGYTGDRTVSFRIVNYNY